jgi:esterase/lipase superfamily enzyme
MRKEVYTIESKILSKNVKIYIYGHYGTNILMFPITEDNPLEYEEIGLIASLSPLIEKGHIKVISVETNNLDSWLNTKISPKKKSDNHFLFNSFLTNELLQFIYNDNGTAVPIITAGANLGAFHAVNSYLRRPDIFLGSIAANGFYDIQWLSGSYYDENCYFNSPLHYLPNLTDDYWLSFLKSQNHLHLTVQEGNWDLINQAKSLGNILQNIGIPYQIDEINTDKELTENINKILLQKILKFNF